MGACFELAPRRRLRKGMLPLCVWRWSCSPAVGCCGTCTGRLSKMKILFSSSAFGTCLAALLGSSPAIGSSGASYPKPTTPGQAGVPASGFVWDAGQCGGGHYTQTAGPTLLRNLKFQRHPWARVLKRRRRSLRPGSYSCMTATSGRPVFLSRTSLAGKCQPQAQDAMSPPGPKSRDGARYFKCSNIAGCLLFFLLAQEAGTVQRVVEVKVGSAPIVDPGARRAKLYGSTSAIYSPAMRYPRYALTTTLSDACKRSYKTALRRARNSSDHSTMYRGRRVQLGVQDGRPPHVAAVHGSRSRSSVLRPVRPHGHRLRVISYNIGGLDTVAYDNLMN